MTIQNFAAALIEIQKNWEVEDFRLCLVEEARYWADLGYSLSRDWETCRVIDAAEYAECRRMADTRNDECHYIRAPFAWAAFYAPPEARISDLFAAWAKGLRREAEFTGEPVDALARLREYLANLDYYRTIAA